MGGSRRYSANFGIRFRSPSFHPTPSDPIEAESMAQEPESNIVGVPGLAQEIDEQLQELGNRNTEDIRAVRR